MTEAAPRFRFHRGSLSTSLTTTVRLPDRAALLAHIRESYGPRPEFKDADLQIEPYPDDRAGWADQHIVIIAGYGVVGMCEGPFAA